MKIRAGSPKDAAALCALHLASIRELCSSAYSAAQIAAWTAQLQPEIYLSAMERLDLLVAEEAQLLGFCIIDLAAAELKATYVHPTATGREVGRRLLEAAEALAQQRALPRLTLKATLNAVDFYQAGGYQVLAETVHLTPSGVALPCVEMIKHLSRPRSPGGRRFTR